jgi:MoaD family protein
MRVSVSFYSYFRDLAGCQNTSEELAEGSNLGDLLSKLNARFPKLEPMQKSMLVAVGVEYQDRRYALKHGDEVALFPPVQGG